MVTSARLNVAVQNIRIQQIDYESSKNASSTVTDGSRTNKAVLIKKRIANESRGGSA